MEISSIDFDTWCKNHPQDHDAKWCRELYPWEVFQRIDYDHSTLSTQQTIVVANEVYTATIEKCYVAENERINYLIRLGSIPSSKRQQWNQRAWNDLFHLVADSSGYFITLYTEKKDPSKVLLRKFLSSMLADIESVRSLPISSLLFRSLISYAAHDSYAGLQRFKSFPVLPAPVERKVRQIQPLRHDTYEPFLSKDRDLWIISSFTEEKAHRQALRLAGQAKKLIAVFCHPTFTQHHRCVVQSASVVSLSEFLRMLSPAIHRCYIQQARFLINNLRQEPNESGKPLTSDAIFNIIKTQQKPMPIHTVDLREAKAGLGMIVTTTGDAAYVCACANLLNAALNQRLKTYDGSLKLAKEVYSFKSIFGRAIEDIIWRSPPDVRVYVERGGLVYISVRGLQFSFHAIPRTSAISAYECSEQNTPQAWAELRLQPVAPLVLKWAKALLLEEKLAEP
jgi:hypothetical protein